MTFPRFTALAVAVLVSAVGSPLRIEAQAIPPLVAGTSDLAPEIGLDARVEAINDFGDLAGARERFGLVWAFRWSAGGGLEDLGPGVAHDINNQGDAAGEGDAAVPASRGLVWTADDAITLSRGPARSVTDRRMVVGFHVTPDEIPHAFLWTPAAGLQDLETLDTGAVPWSFFSPIAEAWSIDEAGRITGMREGLAVVWHPDGRREDLGPGVARDMNDRGVIVGATNIVVEQGRAVVWRDGVETVLPMGAGEPSTATAVNTPGYVVGWLTDGGTTRGFVWHETRGSVRLPAGRALDVDDFGRIVGYVEAADGRHPTLWQLSMTVEERLTGLRAAAGRLLGGSSRRGQVLVALKALEAAEAAAADARFQLAQQRLRQAVHHLRLAQRDPAVSDAAKALLEHAVPLLDEL